MWRTNQDDLAGTGLVAPDRSVDPVGVEVAVLIHISNKDVAVIDDLPSLRTR